MIINHILPKNIVQQNSLLKLTLEEIDVLLNRKNNEYESSIQSIDFVEFNDDEFELNNNIINEEEEILLNLKQTLYSSILLTVYSSFESNLSSIISLVEKSKGSRIKMKDLRREGSYLKCCLRYLELVHGLDISIYKEEIFYLGKVTQLRNCITHSRGLIPTEDDNKKMRNSLIDFIAKENGIELNKDFINIEGKLFIEDFVKTTEAFLLKLILNIKSHKE